MNFKLSKNIKVGSETVSELEIKEEYDCGDMVRIQNAAKKGDGDLFLELISIGTNQPAPIASKITAKDGLKIAGHVKDFLGIGED